MTPEQIASLKAQVDAYEARKVRHDRTTVSCDVCGEYLGTLHDYGRGSTGMTFLELAVGMQSVGKRTYAPNHRRTSKRSDARLFVTRPGPVTIGCARTGCPNRQVVMVARGTVLG